MKNQMLKKGFTLIELIVVIIIIGILSIGAFNLFGGETKNAQFATDVNKLSSQQSVILAKTLKDFTIKGTTTPANTLTYSTVESKVELTGGDTRSDASLTIKEAWGDLGFTNVAVCGLGASVGTVNAKLEIVVNTDASAKEVNGLVLYTGDSGDTDCADGTALSGERIEGMLAVFYNPVLATSSDDYQSSALGDGAIGETDIPVVSRYIDLNGASTDEGVKL